MKSLRRGQSDRGKQPFQEGRREVDKQVVPSILIIRPCGTWPRGVVAPSQTRRPNPGASGESGVGRRSPTAQSRDRPARCDGGVAGPRRWSRDCKATGVGGVTGGGWSGGSRAGSALLHLHGLPRAGRRSRQRLFHVPDYGHLSVDRRGPTLPLHARRASWAVGLVARGRMVPKACGCDMQSLPPVARRDPRRLGVQCCSTSPWDGWSGRSPPALASAAGLGCSGSSPAASHTAGVGFYASGCCIRYGHFCLAPSSCLRAACHFIAVLNYVGPLSVSHTPTRA